MFVKQRTQSCIPFGLYELTAPSNIILIVALRHHQCLPSKISDRGMGCNTWNTFDHAGTMVHNPATSPSSRLRAGQHIAISPSSPGHHIGFNRHPVGTSEHPVPPCTPPCSQRLASPQPITSHLHTTSFISASSISASSHCAAVLATTSTLTAIGLAVGASEAPVPPSAHSLYEVLPTRFRHLHTPQHPCH